MEDYGMKLVDEQIRSYRDKGYLLVPGLFSAGTARQMIDHYMALRAEGPKPGDSGGTTDQPDDPNHKYPRMINMHEWDEETARWASDATLLSVMQQLFDDKPVLCQTMLYFKPPGGRGQALHQDEQYITKDPMIGCWAALDRADADNGRMVVMPGSHKLGVLTVERADTTVSFTAGQSIIPEGYDEIGLDMQAGDALLLDGKLIHGSYSNTTTDRFRRSFIVHFISEHTISFEAKEGYNVRFVAP